MAKGRKVKGKARKTKKVAKKAAGSRKLATARAAAAPASGPVTLDEATALAFAKRPQLAAPAAAAAVAPPASPVAVGVEREKLEKRRREDRERRLREYKATMDIMKQRGARRPAAAGRAADTTGVDAAERFPASFDPLQIVAEGDSWFKYDYPGYGGGIIDRLQRRVGVPIANMAKAGDEVRFMLGVMERKEMIARLTSGSPSGGSWDVLLFSGGGNDIVDNPMALWVRDFDPNVPPADLVHQARFNCALDLVRAGYEDLIQLRDTLSPATHLVFHGYDFAIPDGRGVCTFGPWLKPTFDLRNFPVDPFGARHQVVNTMLTRFAAMLTSLAQPNVTFINTQGTLLPRTSSWHNELHPAKAGFEKFADIFYQKLKQLFPARVA